MVRQGFRHEAMLYRGEDGFLDGTLPFIREGLTNDEAVLVAVSARKAGLLTARLDGAADRVAFLDMAPLGRNPARIIPAWSEFVAENAARGRPFRGIGEPVWPARTAAELDECRRHEALLNVAFDDGPAWRLLCPYDVAALPADAVGVAYLTHPQVCQDGSAHASDAYARGADQLAGTLPPPPADREELSFTAETLREVRKLVERAARSAGMDPLRSEDLVLAVSEIATNSIRYGSGGGRFGLWRADGALVCEVADAGQIEDQLVGRRTPSACRPTQRGLWLVNQVCDLTQIRSSPRGTTVRVHMAVSRPSSRGLPQAGW